MPRRYTHGRKPKFMPAAVAANVALGAAKYAARKYGAKAAAAAAATGVGAALYRKYGPKRRGTTKPKVSREGAARRNTIGQAADSQRKEIVVRQGTKLTSSQLVDKTVKASIQRNIFFWRQYAVESTGAAFNLGLDHSGVGGGTRFLPIYLFDLTARPQFVGGATLPAIFGSRAICDTAGANDGKIRWQSVVGTDSAGGNSNFVQLDEATSLSSLQSNGKSMLNWIDIRAQVQGPRTIPSKVTFQIIKLLDDELDPAPNGSYNQNGTTSIIHQVFWQSQVAGCTVSPVHRYTTPKRNYIKVLASKSFEFNPKESIDNDTRGQLFVLKWFNRLNKVCNYNNVGQTVTDDTSYSSRTIVTNPAGNNVSPYADSKDKIFLLVKAYAPIADSGFNPNLHPSFELNCRMCHSTLV